MPTNPYTTTGGGSQPNLGNTGSGGTGMGFPGINIGAGRNAANRWTQGPEAQLNQQLAQISQLAKTDPQAAQAQLQQAWTSFLDQAAAFTGQYNDAQAAISPELQVIRQSLSNPDLVNTVQALWSETGGQGGLPGLNQAVATSGGGNSTLERLVRLLPDIISIFSPKPGQLPIPKTPTGLPGTDPPGTPTGGIDNPDSGGFDFLDFVKKNFPWMLNTAMNVWGAIDLANAGKEAAKLTADASKEATKFQKDVYNQNRADQLPFLRTSTAANYRLSDLMGLQPQGPRTMPNAVAFQEQPALGSVGVPPSTPGIPNLDQLAAKYRRPQGVV